jgi:hypothetical protein
MRQTSCGEDYLARPIRIVPAQGRGVDEIPTRGPAPARFRGVRVARLARFRVNIQLPAPVWRLGDVTCLSWFAMRSFRAGLAWRLDY